MPPLEALYSGTNVVISDIPVFKEIYKDLPVLFFECENSESLAKKIQEGLKMKAPLFKEEVYSFEKTYQRLIKGIK